MTSIPASADAIDAAWLQQALAPRHPGVRVRGDAIEILEWADDAHVADLSVPAGPAPTADAADALHASVAPSSPSAA